MNATACTHLDAHHGVAGEPGLYGCDECGATWTVAAELPAPTFEAGDRVEYVADGPTAYLRGVHGSIAAVHTLDDGTLVADVKFDGHGALWAIATKYLAHLSNTSGGAVTQPNPAPSDDITPSSLVQLDLAEAAARVASTTDALLTLPADADPATLREAFAAARKALDDFEAASGVTPSGVPITLTRDGATMERHTTDPDLDDLYAAGWVNEWDDYGPECDGCDDDNEPHADGCRRIAQINGEVAR